MSYNNATLWLASWIVLLCFVISRVYACPMPCECTPDLRVVYCNGRGLTTVPTNLPSQTEELHLNGNNITQLQDDTFSGNYTSQLKRLSLAGNQLKGISLSAFINVSSLQILDLSQNYIKSDVFASLWPLGELRELHLGENQISNFHTDFLAEHSQLILLDLHSNDLDALTDKAHRFTTYQPLTNGTEGVITDDYDELNQTTASAAISPLQILDLSQNNISFITSQTFASLPNVHSLNLSHNHIERVDADSFAVMSNLTMLDMSANELKTTPAMLFENNTLLQSVFLHHMPRLTYINHLTFHGLRRLTHLDLSHNRQLFYLHGDTFSSLTFLQHLDVSYSALAFFPENLVQNMTNLTSLSLHGNPWSCDCGLRWLRTKLDDLNQNSAIKDARQIKCHDPVEFRGVAMVDISSENWTCTPAKILNFTHTLYFRIGSSATIDCVVGGDPLPTVMWITPRKRVFIHKPDYIQFDKTMPHGDGYHDNHQWHKDNDYYAYNTQQEQNHPDRIHLLHNGSLFIDYVLRTDGGPYQCFTQNKIGNDSVVIKFKLNYLVIREIKIMSIIVGLGTSFGVFLIAVVITAIRYVAHKCSREQRQKRKSIREILGNIDAYKTIQLDKLRNYKNLTVGTLLNHLEKMRENYSSQVHRIKDNCATHMERVRDNYATHMGKFKDYRSHQIERIRDNYHHQLVRTRDYGAAQLEKLREQYKTQQQHLLKLLEVMNLTNCRGVVEAECLRTESMLFDQDLILDLNTHNLHEIREVSSVSSNEYLTAASSNNSLSSSTGGASSPPQPGRGGGGRKLNTQTTSVQYHAQDHYAMQSGENDDTVSPVSQDEGDAALADEGSPRIQYRHPSRLDVSETDAYSAHVLNVHTSSEVEGEHTSSSEQEGDRDDAVTHV